MLLWHQQYLACCAELNQWDTVAEYAKVTDNCPLQIDAMVQLHDWQNLKAVSTEGRMGWGVGLSTLATVHERSWPFSWSMCVVCCTPCLAADMRCMEPLTCGALFPQMVLPKAQIEDNANATIVRAQMHLQELQVVDVDRICKQARGRDVPRCCALLCKCRPQPCSAKQDRRFWLLAHPLQAMHQAVQQWWNMPEGNPWSYAPVLHTFQVCCCAGGSLRT